MPDPILLLVDDDPETLASLASALERRFGADYRVLTERSPTSALARLEHACERGEDVALVVAHLWSATATARPTSTCGVRSCWASSIRTS